MATAAPHLDSRCCTVVNKVNFTRRLQSGGFGALHGWALRCRERSIFDLCLRRRRTARSPHLMIGFACAGKVPVTGVLFQHPLRAISNTRFVWSGSRVAQRVSVLEIYYFDLGNAKRSCTGLGRWAYQIQIRRLSLFFIFDRGHLFAPRARVQYLRWGSRHQHWCANP